MKYKYIDMKIYTPSDLAKKVFYTVQKIGYYKCLPNYAVKRRKWQSVMICLTTGGKGYLKYNGDFHCLTKGSGYIIDCMPWHLYYTDETELWEKIWVHFEPNDDRLVKYILARSNIFFDTNEGTIESLMHQLLIKCSGTGLENDIVIHNLLCEILTQIISSLEKNNTYRADPINDTVEYIKSNYSNEISLEQLSKTFGLNKYVLIRRFYSEYNCTPYDYLIKYRLNIAKDLLASTKSPVRDIALSVGFKSASHFIKLFKEAEEITPVVYRKKFK